MREIATGQVWERLEDGARFNVLSCDARNVKLKRAVLRGRQHWVSPEGLSHKYRLVEEE